MRRRNVSLIIKITGIVFVAFVLVLFNEVRLGIDRYIKNTLETDASATARDLDKFYKSFNESTIIRHPDLTSQKFEEIYSTALSGDNTKIKCLVDKDGKILDVSREEVGNPTISVSIDEYKGTSHIPIYFSLENISSKKIEKIENTLRDKQDEVISATVVVKAENEDYISQYNNMSIQSISLDGEELFYNEVKGETETIEGTVSYYSNYNLEVTFSPVDVEAYNKSIGKTSTSDAKKTMVYDYKNSTNGLKKQIMDNFKTFIKPSKEIATNGGNYYLLKPYEYESKYYSTIMVRLLDLTLVDSQPTSEKFDDKMIENITVGYIFVTKEYDNLTMNAMKQFLLDNSSTYCLAFILVILICVSIAYIIIKPIRRIQRTAKHISRKEFDYPIDMTRHDELGDLARNIDDMRSELKSTIDNLNQEIDRVQKMEILRKEFVSNFTHEIKTPLGIINGFSELVEIEKDEVKRNEYIHIIQGETKRINELVLAMLDLSKMESQKATLNIESMDLLEIVEKSIESMIYLFHKKEIQLITEFDSAPITADAFKMGMVVNNFISNALRYTESGKSVTIHVDKHILFVENEGQQISEEELKKIWVTFYKIDKSRNEEGTGLGLAICKAILELHQFEYGVENTEKGVLFYVKY